MEQYLLRQIAKKGTKMKSEKIVVTGGAGMIGSVLCERLSKQGHQVVCIDNLSHSSCDVFKDKPECPSIQLIRHDMNTPIDIQADRIYALAAPTSREEVRNRPADTMRSLFQCTLNALELARRNHAPLLYVSSYEVYGTSRLARQPEDYFGNVDTFGLRAASEEGKRTSEALCNSYARQYGTDVKVARIFNTYGENALPDDGRVIPRFIVNAIRGGDMAIYGNGEQTRSFCYVEDIVDGLIRFMALRREETFNPINFGQSHEISIRALAEKIRLLTGSSSKIISLPTSGGESRYRCPDITKARELLGWQPQTSLDDGLHRCIETMRQRLAQKKESNAYCSAWMEVL